MEKSNRSFYLAWQGCCYCSGGCYNYFTDTDNRSCDSVFYYSCNYSLFSFMAEEKKGSMKICAGFQERNPAQNLKNLKCKRSCFTILIPLEYL